MKTLKTRFLSLALAIILSFGAIPSLAISIFAEEGEALTTVAGDDASPTSITATSSDGQYSISVEKDTFKHGEPIYVTAYGPTPRQNWVGITATGANTYYDGYWHYLSESGVGAPFDVLRQKTLDPGEYEIYIVESGSGSYHNSLAKLSVTITNEEYTGEISQPTVDFGDSSLLFTKDNQRVFKKGEPILIKSTGADGDWINVYDNPYQDYNSSYKKYAYVRDMNSTGEYYDLTTLMSFAPGTYLIRLIDGSAGKPYEKMTLSAIYITVTDEEHEGSGGDVGGGEDVGGGDVTDENKKSLSVSKNHFEYGEPILITATGSGSDWVGIATSDGDTAILWYYVEPFQNYFGPGSGVTFDIRQMASKGEYYIGGLYRDTDMVNIPDGEYIIYYVENNQNLTSGYLYSIPITVGDVAGENPPQDNTISAPTSVIYDRTDKNGYAGGTVTVTLPESEPSDRSIVMYWADENGIIDGYVPFRFKATASETSYTITKSTIIPNGATRLLVYSQKTSTGVLSEEFFEVALPNGSGMEISGTPNTSFFVISDIHITSSLSDTSAKNFKKMLSEAFLINPNGMPIFIVGDLANSGVAAEYQNIATLYSDALAEAGKSASDYPLYVAAGNHDFFNGSLSYDEALAQILSFAKLPNGSSPSDLNYDFWLNGYHYVFLGTDSKAGNSVYLDEATITWLDATLAENRSEERPVFIFLHQPMYNTVSGSLPGEGWNGVSSSSEALLREVLKKYPEAVMFNGHTHWEMNSVGNIFEGDSDLPIRIFNCASVSYLWTGYNVITGENLLGSQGYYVELYDGKLVVKGRDFSASKWISPAQYVLSFESTCKHTYEITEISYGNGFNAYGNLTYTCSLCQKETSSACKPMITPKGYSIGPNGNALLAGYDIHSSYLRAYEDIHGTLSIGIAVANPSKFGDGEFLNGDGKLNTEYGIQLEITTRDLARVTCSIDGYSDAQLGLDLVFVFYVIDGSNVHFVQANSPYASDCTIGTRSFLSVSLATVKANLPSQSDEE